MPGVQLRAYPELGFATRITADTSSNRKADREVKNRMPHAGSFHLVKESQGGQGRRRTLAGSWGGYGSSMSDPNGQCMKTCLRAAGRAMVRSNPAAYRISRAPQTNLWLALLEPHGVQAEKWR